VNTTGACLKLLLYIFIILNIAATDSASTSMDAASRFTSMDTTGRLTSFNLEVLIVLLILNVVGMDAASKIGSGCRRV